VKFVRAPHQLPAPVQREVAVTDGKQILIAGGLDSTGASTDGVFSFSPTTGHIANVGTMPQVFHDAAGELLGGRLVVFGGGSSASVDTVQAFDPSSKKAIVIGHLPMPLSDLTGAEIGKTVYLVGGWNGRTPQPTVWSTTTGTAFKKVAALPIGVRYAAVAAVDDKLVVAGGLLADGSETDRIWLVDPSSGSVQTLGTLPQPTAHAMAFAVGGTVYVAGGRNTVGDALTTVTAIDPTSGRTSRAPALPIGLSDAAITQASDGTATLLGGAAISTTSTVLETKPVTLSSLSRAEKQPLQISTPFVKSLPASAAARPFAGRLLIADRGNNRLLVLDPAGHVVWQYPSPSLPPPTLPFYFPDDAFWVHGGNAILVNEEENDVLAEIAYPSGKTLWTYGHPRVGGSSPGYVHQPDDLYPYPGGGLVVADAKNCRILFFNAAGSPSGQIGKTGDCTPGLPNTVGYPNGGTPLPNGNLLISEINGAHISEVTAEHKVMWSTPVPGLQVPSDPQPLADGSFLVVDYAYPGAVIRFTSDGKALWTYRPTSGSGELDHPSLGAPLPNGLVAVNDDYNHRVVLIDPTTDSIVFQYGHTGVAGTGPGYLNTPDGLDLLLPGGITPLHVDFPSTTVHPGRP
jgi:N-acetylneuraminic acid mutarotase